jgi:Phosphatidylinositol-4-phosphate 5-Kinase
MYLVKSVPRRFEHSFFRDDLLEPYVEFMSKHPRSLLIRITDFLGWQRYSLGGLLKLVPTYQIVMENLLVGQDEASASGGDEWATWDLKPADYFFPERDIAGGRLTSEATKSKLADKFEDKITLTQSEADQFLSLLERDTELLANSKAVDYSLFLVRIPLSSPQNPFADEAGFDNAPEPPTYPPFAPPDPPTWRTGIKSSDGKYVYRAAVLDFFWAKHKTHAKLMTLLINAWNLIDRQGHMSITTTPDEYRERFLGMCKSFLEIKG